MRPDQQKRVFYSWQNDSPSKTNRNFIQDVLERACKSLSVRSVLADRAEVVTASSGAVGARPIADMLFEQIESADVFVADVSIVVTGDRPSPNPNVLTETGFALHALKDTRVILLVNEEYGRPELLPFDLRGRLVLTYSYSEREEPAGPRARLLKNLEPVLERILSLPRSTQDIRIELSANDVYQGGEKTDSVLRINIVNLSTHAVRIASWSFIMADGTHSMPVDFQLRTPIPPRDSADVYFSLPYVLAKRPVGVVVHDSLGRVFRTEPAAMAEALKLRGR